MREGMSGVPSWSCISQRSDSTPAGAQMDSASCFHRFTPSTQVPDFRRTMQLMEEMLEQIALLTEQFVADVHERKPL
jgi:hypothetical protein